MGWLRRDPVLRLARRVAPERVLEIGIGQGAMGYRLASRYAYAGIEPDARSRAVARSRLLTLPTPSTCVEDLDALDPDARFDLVCSFEVLEHVDDDAQALTRWATLLAPGGHVLVSVPAHRRRYGPSDRAVGHHRRYDRDDLLELLGAAGLEPTEVLSYGVGLGHAVEAAWDIAMRHPRRDDADSTAERTAASGRTFQPRSRIGGLAREAVTLPFRVLQRPFERTSTGVGWIALARRR